MTLAKLTEGWTKEDHDKFYKWIAQRLKRSSGKWREKWTVAVGIPDRSLRADDVVDAIYISDYVKTIRDRRYCFLILYETLTKKTAAQLNSFFEADREYDKKQCQEFKLPYVERSNTTILRSRVALIIYFKQYYQQDCTERLELNDILTPLYPDEPSKEKLLEVLERCPKWLPQETNLIDLAIWTPSRKGISEKEIIRRTTTIGTEVSMEKFIPLGTFAFKVVGACTGIWRNQDYPPTFWTSLGGICKRLHIPSNRNNRKLVREALYQLHNTWFTTSIWVKDEEGKLRRKGRRTGERKDVYRISIIQIILQEIRPGKHDTVQLQFNPYFGNNIQRGYVTFLDARVLAVLTSPTAQLLYPIIKRQKGRMYHRKLSKLTDHINLRGKRKRETIEKAGQVLIDIGFLESYTIEPGKTTPELVFTAYKKEENSVRGGSRKHLKG